MEVQILKPRTIDFKYLKAKLYVRYWVDCRYSVDGGETWIYNLEDNENSDKKVFYDLPCTYSEWDAKDNQIRYIQLIIDLETGKVVNWTNNVLLETHFKVCDEGEYSFLDKSFNEVINITDEYDQYYVPDFLSLEDEGYGDYVYIDIMKDGTIKHFDLMKDRIIKYFNDLNNED